MRSIRAKAVLLLLGGLLALGLVTLALAIGPGSSEADQGAMHDCPQPGRWAISVWSGDDATETGQALATCGDGVVDFAYYLDPATNKWLGYFDGRPDVSKLLALDNMQGVIAHGAMSAPPPSPTPTPTPIVFEKGDEDLTFHLDTASFELAWTVTGGGWIKLTVFRQEDGFETIVCRSEMVIAGTSGSKVCEGGPGDFRLGVEASGEWVGTICVGCNDWTVRITPQ